MSEDTLTLVDEMIAKGESQSVEFKRSDILSNPIEIAKEMTAFGDTTGTNEKGKTL